MELTIGKETKDLNTEIITKQNQFLETTLGKTINAGMDVGLRLLLPDLIENQVIQIKDELFTNGIQAGIQKAVEQIAEFGKSILGIVTGRFDNISQIQNAVQKGGILDTVSQAIDFAIKVTGQKGILPKKVGTVIRNGKDVLLENISNNIEKEMTSQIKGIENIQRYTQTWKEYFKQKDFKNMEKSYEKLQKELKHIVPIEKTLKEAREIETIHTLIRNKGGDCNLTEEEIKLAQKLTK